MAGEFGIGNQQKRAKLEALAVSKQESAKNPWSATSTEEVTRREMGGQWWGVCGDSGEGSFKCDDQWPQCIEGAEACLSVQKITGRIDEEEV